MTSYMRNPFTGLMQAIGIRIVIKTAAPTNTDYQYAIGSHWFDSTTEKFYIIKQNTVNNATWQELSAGLGDAQDSVLAYTDCTAVPPTEVFGDRYILDTTAGAVNAAWDGAAKADIVEFNGATWVSTTPTNGTLVYNEGDSMLYVFTTSWNSITTAIPDATTAIKGKASFAAANFSVTTGAVSIIGGGLAWSVVTGATAGAVNNAYICNHAAARVVVTLPDTAAVGSVIKIVGMGIAGWQVSQNAGEQIFFGDQATTAGVGGSLASTGAYDCIELVCNVANTSWIVSSSIGNITVV